MNKTIKEKTLLYQTNSIYFAQCRHGIEDIVADELREIGALDISTGFSGVHFKASDSVLYSIIYSAKTVSRVLAPIAEFNIKNTEELYYRTNSIEWENIFNLNNSFSVSSSVSNSCISNSHFALLKVKDAVADRFIERTVKRPDVNREDPDIRINLNLRNDKVRISLDASGEPMHKRGYRIEKVTAPLNETLAAAIIRISGWDGKTALYDPMTGSGTILAEGLLKLKKIPSGFKKDNFGIFSFPDFDKMLWEKIKNKFDDSILEFSENIIAGSDINKDAIRAAKKNLAEIPQGEKIKLSTIDFREIPSLKERTIITNLPYGERLENKRDAEKLYKEFGDFLKNKCTGSKAFLLCGSTDLVKKIGLRTKRKIPFFNGPIEARLIELDLY